MIYLIWKMDDIVVIAGVTYEQLTGLIRDAKGKSVGVIE